MKKGREPLSNRSSDCAHGQTQYLTGPSERKRMARVSRRERTRGVVLHACTAFSEHSDSYKTSGLPIRSQLESRPFQYRPALLRNSACWWIPIHRMTSVPCEMTQSIFFFTKSIPHILGFTNLQLFPRLKDLTSYIYDN